MNAWLYSLRVSDVLPRPLSVTNVPAVSFRGPLKVMGALLCKCGQSRKYTIEQRLTNEYSTSLESIILLRTGRIGAFGCERL